MKFREYNIQDRIETIIKKFDLNKEVIYLKDFVIEADNMVENCIGSVALPVGLVIDFKVNGKIYNVPLATEEPSVIAALNFANKVVGGVSAKVIEWLSLGTIYFELSKFNFEKKDELASSLSNFFTEKSTSMKARGGGFRELSFCTIGNFVRLDVYFDTVDALGANFINSQLELSKLFLKEKFNQDALFCILSNDYTRRVASAKFQIKINQLSAFIKDNSSPLELAQKIVWLSNLASFDAVRAVTHNKGIANAIEALAIATCNDSRAVEAAMHSYACKDGFYKGLSKYKIENDTLLASLTVPVPFAIVGGAIGKKKLPEQYFKMMGVKSAKELAALAAALGILQNFSALKSIAHMGINEGHMRLHLKKNPVL